MELASRVDEAVRGAQAVVIQTEWEEYRGLDWETLASIMEGPAIVVDARRLLDPLALRAAGLRYYGVGWPAGD